MTVAPRPHVVVVMSTWNGVAHLREQLESILAQRRVSLSVCVRDDGSQDGTADLAESLLGQHADHLLWWMVERGENLGPTGSFIAATALATGANADYLSWADQDDVWMPDKLDRAVRRLTEAGADTGLYAAMTTVCDERGRRHVSRTRRLDTSLPAELVRHRLAGHTMLMTPDVAQTLVQMPLTFGLTHDQWAVIVTRGLGKGVVVDDESRTLHRRLPTSVTKGGRGLSQRLRHETNVVLNRQPTYARRSAARYLLSRFPAMDSAERRMLTMMAHGGWQGGYTLMLTPALRRAHPVFQVETLASVMLRTFDGPRIRFVGLDDEETP